MPFFLRRRMEGGEFGEEEAVEEGERDRIRER
jgi:hypothetical protein